MKQELQTEQFLELDNEQLTAVTGGKFLKISPDIGFSATGAISGLTNKLLSKNNTLTNGLAKKASAKLDQTLIRKNAQAGKTFEVGKSWADRLSAKA